MKNVIVVLIAFIFVIDNSNAQTCLVEGINFSTQAQIDSFQVNYPGCTEIEGYVIIGAENGWDDIDIENFDSLINVTSIGGYLKFWNNDPLSDFTGFNNLTTIGGDLLIESNSSLESLNGLDNLSAVGGELRIYANNYLTSAAGMDNLTTIGDGLRIENNNAIPSVSGLESIISINGGFVINSNYSLTSLSGLDNIDATSITHLYITSNASLSECAIHSVCDYFELINFEILISGNATGCANITEVETACIALDVEEKFNGEDVLIYPNPANSKIYISENVAYSEVSIYNQLGQNVFQEDEFSGELDISNLKSGIYIIEVHAGNIKLREKLIIE